MGEPMLQPCTRWLRAWFDSRAVPTRLRQASTRTGVVAVGPERVLVPVLVLLVLERWLGRVLAVAFAGMRRGWLQPLRDLLGPLPLGLLRVRRCPVGLAGPLVGLLRLRCCPVRLGLVVVARWADRWYRRLVFLVGFRRVARCFLVGLAWVVVVGTVLLVSHRAVLFAGQLDVVGAVALQSVSCRAVGSWLSPSSVDTEIPLNSMRMQ